MKRLGLAPEAEKRWRAALELKPNYAEAYSNLAGIETARYCHADALRARGESADR
jgi:Flp pilus assembly protein TadD